MNRNVLLIALAAALLPGLAGADDKTTVYRTVNADGTVTYSQIQSDGAQAQTVDGRDPGTAAAADAPAADAAPAVPKTPEQQGCESSKKNLEVLNSGQPLLRTDPQGNKTQMTPEDIAREKATAERMVAALCPPQS